jgi:hypothetical protein
MDVYNDTTLSDAIGELRSAYAKHRRLKVSIRAGKRSADQNEISHVWYDQIARELREDTVEGVKCECKLRFGVPILRAEDADFRAFYDAAIKGSLSYEDKVRAMRFLPVTSLMTPPQMSRYLEDMQKGYAGRVALEFPMERAA